jgi:hypothetical protein
VRSHQPVEDIAESRAIFVLGLEPPGYSVVNQKLLFFDSFPERVNLRAKILQNLCTAHP